MSLQRNDFTEFFAALHGGAAPFAWQERLLDELLTQRRWPDRVVAPTGAGKTSVIDVHVFALALTVGDGGPRLPRRLSMVVGRRVLVDDQYEYAQQLAQALTGQPAGVLAQVAHRLAALREPGSSDDVWRGERQETSDEVSPLVVARLRGGQPASRAWIDLPAAAAVLCATPDMWGSRLLMRGYGSSRQAWPREAGLLAFDSVAVVDEAHLAQQLVHTARRIGELALVADQPLGVPPLRVVETTATPGPDAANYRDVGVDADDLANPVLADRLTRPKPVTLVESATWEKVKGPAGRKAAVAMADQVVAALGSRPANQEGPVHTVGCITNTVRRALDVAAQLRTREVGGRPLSVLMICGQVRPHDLDELRARYPGVLSPSGHRTADGDCLVDVIVSTQSLEVGVDLDLAAMVTELAPGTALAQRAGRVNRRGLRPDGPVVVLVPPELGEKTRSGPYVRDELVLALDWVTRRAADPKGLAPWQLREDPAPGALARRPRYQRPEWADAALWARTSESLWAEPELDLWLADSLETADTSVNLVVRRDLPTVGVDAVRVVTDLPVQQHEMFTVPLASARSALGRWRLWVEREWRPAGDEVRPSAEFVRVRGDEITAGQWRSSSEQGPVPQIRPGDTVVVDAAARLFSSAEAGLGGGFSPQVVLEPEIDVESPEAFSAAADVMSAHAELPQVWEHREVGGVILRLPAADGSRWPSAETLAKSLAGVEDDPALLDMAPWRRRQVLAAAQRAALLNWLDDHVDEARGPVMLKSARTLLRSHRPWECELSVEWAEDSGDGERRLRWLALRDRRRTAVDTDLMQVWSPATDAVLLDAHQRHVGQRADWLARACELPPSVREMLRLAGEHHDDGKSDSRFQVRLGAAETGGHQLLAKSRPQTAAETARSTDGSGLPVRWRHEQRSVLDIWPLDLASASPGTDIDRALVARLAGTSHGHGRCSFPHTALGLLAGSGVEYEHAGELFDDGGWEELMDRTHERYGLWGCAYLEAVLRAADCQVSAEGS
jgi:CRISPR-associated endonuclease/helicase Cas3